MKKILLFLLVGTLFLNAYSSINETNNSYNQQYNMKTREGKPPCIGPGCGGTDI